VAEAAVAGADVLVTVGAPQSNHCRSTTAAARAVGMDSHLVFSGHPVDEVQGNLVLDRLLGETWSFAGD
jgi:1-aminocyclopropane-1-carboxylate deaminase/D-cysteine desulfhydrase-like pyridoxal-dependent ACC family enzyme